MEEIDIKCKKFSEVQGVLRNATRRIFFNHSLTPCSQFGLIRDNYFYSVHRYFVILSIEKLYDIVIY